MCTRASQREALRRRRPLPFSPEHEREGALELALEDRGRSVRDGTQDPHASSSEAQERIREIAHPHYGGRLARAARRLSRRRSQGSRTPARDEERVRTGCRRTAQTGTQIARILHLIEHEQEGVFVNPGKEPIEVEDGPLYHAIAAHHTLMGDLAHQTLERAPGHPMERTAHRLRPRLDAPARPTRAGFGRARSRAPPRDPRPAPPAPGARRRAGRPVGSSPAPAPTPEQA